MIKSIHIQGFRGISSLKIDDFKKINLFLGKNNCGKTSILEALFLIIGISNPQLSLNINKFRNLLQTESDDFRFIFNKLDFNINLNITADFSSGDLRILTIKPHSPSDSAVNNAQKIKQNGETTASTSSKPELVDGLVFNFSVTKNKKSKSKNFQSEILLSHGTYTSKSPKSYVETVRGVFVSANTPYLDLSKNLENMIITKQKDIIIRALQLIDPTINDISLGNNNMIYVDLGYERLVPVNVVGYGIVRLLSIITTISFYKNGIVVIDEIENGLHYSSLKVLWKTIFEVAHQNNVQLFITTHSKETLENLKYVLKSKNFQQYQGDTRSFTIRRHDEEKIISYPYDFEKFDYSIEQEIEMR